ncbi:MAG TPA: error-prone DNA polymerase, partial [Sorangium sp.]|nr:error-prone DNA polymerase [Sorangium sp.]
EFQLQDGPKLVLLCENLAGYTALCALITRGRRAAAKGTYHLTRKDLADGLPGTLALWLPNADADAEHGAWLHALFADRLWLAVELHCGPDDARRLRLLEGVGATLGIPLVAAGDVHMHVRRRRALQDVLTAIGHRQTVAEAGAVLFKNGERHLRTREALAAIYPAPLRAETLRLADRCQFSLSELRYRYPAELVPDGHTAASWLRHLTEQGIGWRWPDGVPDKIRAQIEYELQLVAELAYEPYFLTVHDIVHFARSRHILCQGRGSAANSAVCYALGITEVDPARINLLVERFISKERNEPPDIDVDFEHERREEVFQYIYAKYGRDRAALAATVISYRGKSAVRDVARALGLPPDQVDLLSKVFAWWNGQDTLDERLRERGFDPASPVLRRVLKLTAELMGFPRHLSQHVGGFVISDQPLHHLVPVENAAMPERTIIQWDKDDLDALGLLKVDCLALGMLTCVSKCLALLHRHRGQDYSLATIPAEDSATYAMIQKADTVGVFQIESRAQMAMLPRLKPSKFYDLVIEVAIVRPGPIQGGMVHPYLRRRTGQEPPVSPHPCLDPILERTLGVPLFQEQVMQIAMVGAGYTPGEADQLRRDMAAWKKHGRLERHRGRLIQGFAERGISAKFGEMLYQQIQGFGEYGFPESHAASFALLVYASAWLKVHHQAAFTCALLNAQPMGFYSPSALVQDAQRHGVEVRPVCVARSAWDATLEPGAEPSAGPPLRLGMRLVKGLGEAAVASIMAAREDAPFKSLPDLVRRAELKKNEVEALAEAGALAALVPARREALWRARAPRVEGLFEGVPIEKDRDVGLPPLRPLEQLALDYGRVGLSLHDHPMRHLRPALKRRRGAGRVRTAEEIKAARNGETVRVAGMVVGRQRPATASGVTFVTLEDETGVVNVIVQKQVFADHYQVARHAALLLVAGRVERQGEVIHVVARELERLELPSGEEVALKSRDYH